MPSCRNCGRRHWPYQSCPRDSAILLALLLLLAPLAAQAHPGHGETHAHPELWVAVVLVALIVSYFRRRLV